MRPIDADALKEDLVKDLANTMRMMEMHKGDMALRVLNKLDESPTLDVAPVVHGRWDDSLDGITPYCTECGRTHKCFNRTPNYCPNCGAKMDGDKDE
jgi:rubrerythrin